MANRKKVQRLFLRLLSETFFVSDEALNFKKIDRLVRKLDHLAPIPSSATSAEESLQRWLLAQGIDSGASADHSGPIRAKRGWGWRTGIASAAAVLLIFFLVIKVPAMQQAKMAPNGAIQYDNDNWTSVEESCLMMPEENEKSEEIELLNPSKNANTSLQLFNSVDRSLPMGEWLQLKIEAGESLTVTGIVTDATSDGTAMNIILHTEQGTLGLLLSGALVAQETILDRQICVWVQAGAYAEATNLEFQEVNAAAIEVEGFSFSDKANLAIFLADDDGNLQAVYGDDSRMDEFPQTLEMWNSQFR